MPYLKKPTSEDRVTMQIKIKYHDGTIMDMILENALETAAQAILHAGGAKKVSVAPEMQYEEDQVMPYIIGDIIPGE